MSRPNELRIGAALEGRYTIIREIGRGGMATVFLAHDVKHERDVALKVLHRELGALLGAERFLAEIRTTAQLHHPNILPLFDSGEADGLVFYVMPYIEGENLRERVTREGQLGVTDAVRIVQAVADALEHAHKHGVVHRDIKPENILLQDGHPLIADFGIAIAVSNAGGQRITQTGFSLGTPQYMSPEQAAAERHVDGKSDQYSLAAVLYELLVGEPPFTGPNAPAIMSRMMSEPAPDVSRRRASVPEQVTAAVGRALEKVPGDRFPSLAAFRDAIQVDTGGRQTELVRARMASHRATSTWRIATGVMSLIAVAALAVALRAPRGAVDPEPRQWSITLDDSLPMSTSHDQYGTATRSLDLAPDGRTLLYTAPSANGERIVSVNLETGISAVIPNTTGARSPTFSPDSRSFAAIVGDSELRRYSVADGSSVHLASGGIQSLAWPTAGQILANGGCTQVPASGGNVDYDRKREACNGTWVASDASAIRGNAKWLFLDVLGVIKLMDIAGTTRSISHAGTGAATAAVIRGAAPRFVAPGYLVYLRGSTLQAVPFDPVGLAISSTPQAAISSVRGEQSGTAQFAVSNDGTIVWESGADPAIARFVWVDRAGRVLDTLRFIPPTEVASFALSNDGRRLAYSALAPDGSAALIVADLARQVIDKIPSTERLEPVAWLDHGSALSAVLTRPNGSTRGARIGRVGENWIVDTTAAGYAVQSVDASVTCRSPVFASTEHIPVLIWRAVAPFDSMVYRPGPDEDGASCSISPDGRRVLLSDNDGWSVAPIGTDGVARRIHVIDGSAEPRWSPDGQEIVYRRATEWYAVRAPGPDMQPGGTPHLLFRGSFLQAFADWDRGPDGRFLLLAGEPAPLKTHLNVITNFPSFLARKLGAEKP